MRMFVDQSSRGFRLTVYGRQGLLYASPWYSDGSDILKARMAFRVWACLCAR